MPVSALERVRLQSDLETLTFAQAQIANLEEALAALAAQDERLPPLVQLPGVGWLTAITILAAIATSPVSPTPSTGSATPAWAGGCTTLA